MSTIIATRPQTARGPQVNAGTWSKFVGFCGVLAGIYAILYDRVGGLGLLLGALHIRTFVETLPWRHICRCVALWLPSPSHPDHRPRWNLIRSALLLTAWLHETCLWTIIDKQAYVFQMRNYERLVQLDRLVLISSLGVVILRLVALCEDSRALISVLYQGPPTLFHVLVLVAHAIHVSLLISATQVISVDTPLSPWELVNWFRL